MTAQQGQPGWTAPKNYRLPKGYKTALEDSGPAPQVRIPRKAGWAFRLFLRWINWMLRNIHTSFHKSPINDAWTREYRKEVTAIRANAWECHKRWPHIFPPPE
jgi:hypothetical protein